MKTLNEHQRELEESIQRLELLQKGDFKTYFKRVRSDEEKRQERQVHNQRKVQQAKTWAVNVWRTH